MGSGAIRTAEQVLRGPVRRQAGSDTSGAEQAGFLRFVCGLCGPGDAVSPSIGAVKSGFNRCNRELHGVDDRGTLHRWLGVCGGEPVQHPRLAPPDPHNMSPSAHDHSPVVIQFCLEAQPRQGRGTAKPPTKLLSSCRNHPEHQNSLAPMSTMRLQAATNNFGRQSTISHALVLDPNWFSNSRKFESTCRELGRADPLVWSFLLAINCS